MFNAQSSSSEILMYVWAGGGGLFCALTTRKQKLLQIQAVQSVDRFIL